MDRHTVKQRRKELAAQLPALAVRVFALLPMNRTSMMKQLGAVMRNLNDYDAPYDHTNLVLDEVIFEDLVETVTAAERSLSGVG